MQAGARADPPAAAAAAAAAAAFERVARLADIPDWGLLGVEKADGTRVCLIRIGSEIRAVANNCTHQEFPISDGILRPDGRLECAWHGAEFDTASGRAVRYPATEPLAVFAVRVDGDDILVGGRIR